MAYQAEQTRYESMQYRRCGNSGVLLPAMSLGLWHGFGGTGTLEQARKMILGAFDLGITHFDLANNYGPPPGSAEETFGRVLRDDLRPYRDELFIASKAGYSMWPGPYGEWGSRKSLMASLDQSLRRLGLDYVDLFYHHRPDPDTPLEETMDALCDIVRQGKALYVGLSNYGPEDTRRAVAMLGERGVRCLVHQLRYSMLARENEPVLDALDELNVGAVAFSPLAQGLLTDKYLGGIPADSRAAGESVFLTRDGVTEEAVSKARALNRMAESKGVTLAQMALAWVLRRAASVIMGASRPEQVAENVRALAGCKFSADELAEIEAILGMEVE